MSLQVKQILYNIKDPIIMAADRKSLTRLAFSMHKSTFGSRKSEKRGAKSGPSAIAVLSPSVSGAS